jgi:hypothetical protein
MFNKLWYIRLKPCTKTLNQLWELSKSGYIKTYTSRDACLVADSKTQEDNIAFGAIATASSIFWLD